MQSVGRISVQNDTILASLLPPIILIVAVLGSILTGVATPTEAAGVGAIGTLLLAGDRLSHGSKRIRLAALALAGLIALANLLDLRLNLEQPSLSTQIGIWIAFGLCGVFLIGLATALKRTYDGTILNNVMLSTSKITSMVFIILIGAALFSLVFRGLEGDEYVHELLTNMPRGPLVVMLCLMLIMFFLGFFLDFIEITFVVVPIVAPILLQLGFDPVWLGIMMALNLQTSFLTPPFGFALFYLRGVAPDSLKTLEIYKGAIPFVVIQIILIAVLVYLPDVVTWLPDRIFG